MDIPFVGSKRKPRYFKIQDEDDEYYMIGSEVGAYMNLFRGAIYKKYPSLWRRLATTEERNQIQKLYYSDVTNFATSITLVKALDIKNIIEGLDEKYKISLGQPPSVIDTASKSAKLIGRTVNPMNLANVSSYSAYNKNFKIFNRDRTANYNFKLNDFDIFSEPISLLTPTVGHTIKDKILVKSNNSDNNEYTIKSKSGRKHPVPIRIYIEKDGIILNDILLWDISNDCISMDDFSKILCSDIGYSWDVFGDLIINEMKSQIKNYIENISKLSKLTHEIKMVIKTDILIKDVNYCDQFNWTIVPDEEFGYRSGFDPLEFAHIVINDLNLSQEFIPPLVCSIYGQVNYYMSHPNLFSHKHSSSGESEGSYSYLHLQNEQDLWTPTVKVLSMNQIKARHDRFAKHLKLIQKCISLNSN